VPKRISLKAAGPRSRMHAAFGWRTIAALWPSSPTNQHLRLVGEQSDSTSDHRGGAWCFGPFRQSLATRAATQVVAIETRLARNAATSSDGAALIRFGILHLMSREGLLLGSNLGRSGPQFRAIRGIIPARPFACRRTPLEKIAFPARQALLDRRHAAQRGIAEYFG